MFRLDLDLFAIEFDCVGVSSVRAIKVGKLVISPFVVGVETGRKLVFGDRVVQPQSHSVSRAQHPSQSGFVSRKF
ncbi:MAG: hypothetical protein JMDDDDMK_03647 [Acidobacteria bacterium]|nr:hypothetical protein [Acidobacteriota bacterium]